MCQKLFRALKDAAITSSFLKRFETFVSRGFKSWGGVSRRYNFIDLEIKCEMKFIIMQHVTTYYMSENVKISYKNGNTYRDYCFCQLLLKKQFEGTKITRGVHFPLSLVTF